MDVEDQGRSDQDHTENAGKLHFSAVAMEIKCTFTAGWRSEYQFSMGAGAISLYTRTLSGRTNGPHPG